MIISDFIEDLIPDVLSRDLRPTIHMCVTLIFSDDDR